MKIVYVITSLGIGGAETQVCSLADKMVDKGHDVTIVCLHGDVVVSPKSSRIKIIKFGLSSNIISILSTFLKLLKLVKKERPDVIHSHMFHANIISRMMRIFVEVPVLISSAHSSNEGGIWRTLAYRYTDNLTDLTTNVGKLSVERYIKIGAAPRSRIISVHNGIDTDKFNSWNCKKFRDELGIDTTDKLVVTIGRNVIEKDYTNLLKAISKVELDFVKFVIIGKDCRSLIDLVNQFNIKDRVKLIDVRLDIPEILNSADLLLMSSRVEGLPIVIGEAMASSCNIITTDAGGCREWLTAREIPVMIENSDALASAIIDKMLQSDEKWLEISNGNRNHIINQFSLDIVADKWIGLYSDPNYKKSEVFNNTK